MTKYKYTIYKYGKTSSRPFKLVHHSSYTDNIRTIMNNVKRLKVRYYEMNLKVYFTVKFEKIV